MNPLNCATGTLAPYVPSEGAPWNRKRVQHLYRRMDFGIAAKNIEAVLAKSPSDLVDEIVNEAMRLPLADAPYWANYTRADYEGNEEYIEQSISWATQWIGDMFTKGFREKLALFWHNHFVTELDTYVCPSWQYAYHSILQEHALGNFKTFVKEIGKTPAMLFYLNGVQNTRSEPNENYARELYELFTLGVDNGYTQRDIVETARALTGWNGFTEFCAPIAYSWLSHDNGRKTIFGRTDRWDYDSLHDLLFEERGTQLAKFICTKIYKHFVSPKVDETIVEGMAATFQANNFELAPVFRELFKSEHFFDAANIGVVIKSPIDYLIGVMHEWGLDALNEDINRYILYTTSVLGQRLFNPIDVAGWPGDKTWVDSSRIPSRWQFAFAILGNIYENVPQYFLNLGLALTGDSNDPYYVSRMIIDYIIPNGLQDEDAYERAAIVFKSEVPENYYEDGSWSLYWESGPTQVALLIQYLIRQPDFQLA